MVGVPHVLETPATPRMTTDGFRVVLEKAIRRSPSSSSWTDHTVDYANFKHNLRHFAERRAKIRSLLAKSQDGKIADELLIRIVKDDPNSDNSNNNNDSYYYHYPEETASDLSRGASSSSKRLPQRESSTTSRASAPGGDYMAYVDPEASIASEQPSPTNNNEGGTPNTKRRSKRSAMRKISSIERAQVLKFLNQQVDQAHMFYLSQWQHLSFRLETFNQQQPDFTIGDEILELYAFVVINIVTIRQILIRYDAFARTFEGTPLLNYYMKKNDETHCAFRKLLTHDEVIAMADSYAQMLDSKADTSIFQSQQIMFQQILNSSQAAQSVASTGQGDTFTDSFIYSLRDWFLLGAFQDRLGLEPAFLTMRGKSLTDEMQKLADWRQKKHDTAVSQKQDNEKTTLNGMQVFHLTLNLISAFLYCMNYYIVEPSSTMYVNRLGAHDAMSGTLIGMMPLAAFCSSIPFSIWTNHSFRYPVLMSGTLLILGNLLYSVADQRLMLRMALLGRFIAGFGAPKCIIRRYMADTTPLHLRTSVNSLYGMVVAAGSAMGPAMALVLNKIEYTVAIPYLGIFTLNGLTLPGYFMACLWLTYTIIVLLTFEEPNREGLEEQKKLEQKERKHAVSLLHSHTASEDDQELRMIFSHEEVLYTENINKERFDIDSPTKSSSSGQSRWHCLPLAIRRAVWKTRQFFDLITWPVRLCLGLLFAKVFTIEALVSATSALSKNRYGWKVKQVGTLGLTNGCLVIPFSIFVGRLSMSYQDHVLMKWLVGAGCFGMFLLIDFTDLMGTDDDDYNEQSIFAVGPRRYILGYFISYLAIQSFEGVIGSTLSKVIPTALASGTINSGLLATLTDTLGRACGDLFISLCGYVELRQLMNLLFIPGFLIMLTCFLVIRRYKDMLAV